MHAAPAARLLGQLLLVRKEAAFAPVSEMELTVRVDAPVFVSVTVCTALGVATLGLWNARDVEETVAEAPLPVPVRAMV